MFLIHSSKLVIEEKNAAHKIGYLWTGKGFSTQSYMLVLSSSRVLSSIDVKKRNLVHSFIPWCFCMVSTKFFDFSHLCKATPLESQFLQGISVELVPENFEIQDFSARKRKIASLVDHDAAILSLQPMD